MTYSELGMLYSISLQLSIDTNGFPFINIEMAEPHAHEYFKQNVNYNNRADADTRLISNKQIYI